MKKFILLVVQTMVCLSWAKTVAFWPIEYDPVSGYCDCTCRCDPANDLSAAQFFRCEGAPWTLPANPDTSIPPDFARNSVAVANTNTANVGSLLSTATAGKFLRQTLDFTVEGWVKFLAVPSGGAWWYLVGAMEQSANKHRWFCSLRHENSSNRLYWCFATEWTGDQKAYLDTLGQDAASLTNGWHHFAVTHDAQNASGKSVWVMYLDGCELLTVVENVRSFAGEPSNSRFDIGGRPGSSSNRTVAQFDYWRISDELLSPEQFLNAGGTGTTIPLSPTVAYWKLGRTESGNVDVNPAVGLAQLNGLLGTSSKYYSNSTGVSDDRAFVGLPPNMNMTPSPTVQLENEGSLYGLGIENALVIENLGAELTLTNSFTVEGWVKPQRRSYASQTTGLLFLTRRVDYGFQLGLRRFGSSWKVILYARDFVNDRLFPGSPNAGNDAVLSGELADWDDWRHLALVYDYSDGNGVWKVYLDGELTGSVANDVAPQPAEDIPTEFHLLGRSTSDAVRFGGLLDYMRVCKAALAPNQFLNATNGVPATNVIALLPMNVERGAHFDGRDCVGSYTVSANRPGARMVHSVTNAPVIGHPDTTASFRGDPSTVNGAVRFRDDAQAGDVAGKNAFLGCNHADVCEVCRRFEPYTVECWIRRNETTSTDWELVYAFAWNLTPSGLSAWQGLAHSKSKGFYMADSIMGAGGDSVFPTNTIGIVPVGEWSHLAVTRQFASVGTTTNVVYELFVNGHSKGNVTRPVTMHNPGVSSFVLGGRGFSANSFQGEISSVRISRTALPPEEFLCAEGMVRPHETLAYWPLDFSDGIPDLASRVNPWFSFVATDGLAGSSDRARGSVPHPDETMDFEGDHRRNVGSVALTAGKVSTLSLGAWTPPTQSCTIEGWFKWNGADGCVVGTEDVKLLQHGWHLSFESGRLRIFGQTNAATTPFVNGTLLSDTTELEGKWVHLALVYSNASACGCWSLYIDGVLRGTCGNTWLPSADFYAVPVRFCLGNSMTGGYDMWRVTAGVLKPEEFLWTTPQGVTILFR